MKTAHKNYQKVLDASRQATLLEGISHILDWDQETYMPPGAADNRGEQFKVLAGVIHKQKTSKKFASLLAKLIDLPSGKIVDESLSADEQAAALEWRRDFVQAKALPNKFVENTAKLTSQSILVWREAKEANSFKTFAPFLKKIIEMSRKKADYLGYQDHPYDALLDLYEPNSTVKHVSAVFAPLRQSIQKLLLRISSAKQIDDSFLYGTFSKDKQMEFAELLLNDLGYSRQHGRLDISTHPFSTSAHPTDSRITTRLHATSLMSCVSTVLHEVGHAFYEMGLPQEHFGSPLGQALSLSMHESQSRWWETRIGQSKGFWIHYLPLLKKHFNLQDIPLDDFYRAINKVEPSFIRVEADEVSYSLHVILRFEMEKALIEGSLAVKDVPEAWNTKMHELLGITPKTNAEGCLQDVHWSMGGLGYFPTYTMGNLYAAHLFEAFEKEYPQWETAISKGENDFIKKWLTTSIHAHGRRFPATDLLKSVTGKEFSAEAFSSYLDKKYSRIYGLNN